MCKAVVESNLKEGGNVGAGLNNGILYLMAMPYVAALLFGIFYFLQKKKRNSLNSIYAKIFFPAIKIQTLNYSCFFCFSRLLVRC